MPLLLGSANVIQVIAAISDSHFFVTTAPGRERFAFTWVNAGPPSVLLASGAVG
jgi:hypothetical protein